jgi:hypothetical protein
MRESIPHLKTSLERRRDYINLRLERWHRFCIYGACGWLTATGLLWLAAHYFWRPVGEFGETISPWEPLSMKLHGAGAMVILFFAGSLLNIHIRRALKVGRNISSGWCMLALLLLLTASGYVLYYLAGEGNRNIWSMSHWLAGLAFPMLLLLHIVLGRKGRTA